MTVDTTDSDGYILAGLYTIKIDDDTSENYAWIFKTDGSGNIIWQRSTKDAAVGLTCVKNTSYGYVVAGINWINQTDYLSALFSLNEDGLPPGNVFEYEDTNATIYSISPIVNDTVVPYDSVTIQTIDTHVVVEDASFTVIDY